MRFTKMHGLGNDYVYVSLFDQPPPPDPAALAVAVSDRHFGIGGDGLILIGPSERADARMRMFNADGSEGEMCGNGVRCVARYLYDHGLAPRERVTVETGRGVLTLDLEVEQGRAQRVRVDMGAPILRGSEIPTTLPGDPPLDVPVTVEGRTLRLTAVSMGNPHAVAYVEDVGGFPVAALGPVLERHPAFPRRVNVHFVEVLGPAEVRMRTWERGSGITLACGTGACAVCVAGVLTGRTGRRLLAHLPGGDLELEWPAAGTSVFMTGPATEVFTGEWNASDRGPGTGERSIDRRETILEGEIMDPSAPRSEVHAMQCMEIWGGSSVTDRDVSTPGLDAWVYSKPYEGAVGGGDVHYVSLCGGGIITRLIVADVSGHGAAVAELAASLRALMRKNINSKSQTSLVEALNQQFAELAQMSRFATAVVATYLANRRRLTLCNAGHPHPLWYRAASREWKLLTQEAGESDREASNLPLGLDDQTPYVQFSVALDPDDIVMVYTDALIEAQAPDRHMLGEAGLLEIAGGLDVGEPRALGEALLAGVDRYRGGLPADDDVTLLTLHHNAGGPRRLSLGEKLDVYAKVFGLKAV